MCRLKENRVEDFDLGQFMIVLGFILSAALALIRATELVLFGA